jgi:hypothetical protein
MDPRISGQSPIQQLPATAAQESVVKNGRSHSMSVSTNTQENPQVTQKIRHVSLPMIKINNVSNRNQAYLEPARISKGAVEKPRGEASELENLTKPPVIRKGNFYIKVKSRPEILGSSLARLGLSSLGALTRIPLSILRMVASPFTALVGVIALPINKQLGKKLLFVAGLDAIRGIVNPLTSVVEILGSAIGSVVDPIAGKPIIRTAQLWTETMLLMPIPLFINKVYKYPPPTMGDSVIGLLNKVTLLSGSKRKALNNEGDETMIVTAKRKGSKFSPSKDYYTTIIRAADITSRVGNNTFQKGGDLSEGIKSTFAKLKRDGAMETQKEFE